MVSLRGWRPAPHLEGPYRATAADIAPMNVVFSDAFSERYRRDGMVGVRVPNLNPLVWRYAIEDAAEGAVVWRDSHGEIAAFNMVHHSGVEGWMGPLAVRTDFQGHGGGKEVVMHGVSWLKAQGARVIGLETMPRTMDNIGFYSSLGFVPGRMTITLTLDAATADHAPDSLSRLGSRDRADVLTEANAMVNVIAPGHDFTRELELTSSLALGDTVLLREKGVLVGFALCHTVPLVEGRAREELRVLKLVLARESLLDPMVLVLCDFARRAGTRRVAFRVQGEYASVYQRLIALGARVRWTDLRMSLHGYHEMPAREGILMSNWEI